MKRQAKDEAISKTTMDITSVLRGWTFQPGQVNVRLIRGNDGKPKLQLRLDLGLLQMELDGRPDGKKPHKAPTELEFFRRKLATYTKKHGSDSGFTLASEDCQSLREESAMFYHRYLSLFVLEQYDAVIRDTQHNLDVLDLCHRYGKTEYDRMCLEQYRAYIVMMNTRGKACEALRQGFVQTSIAYLRGGIKRIANMMPKEHRKKMLRQSHEAHILLDMLKQIRSQLPPDPRIALRKKIKEAVAAERFEEAAQLRDQLDALMSAMAQSHHHDEKKTDTMPSEMPAAVKPKRGRKPRQKKTDAGPEEESR